MSIINNKRQGLLFIAITALGISSIITQLTAIREFLSVFYGNELIFGIILANWLLLTGIGAYLGKYIKEGKISWLIISEIIIAFLPFFHIAIIRNLRNLIFLKGELIGITKIFLSSFLILMPYCLISGFLLTLACCIFSIKKDSASIGKVYFMDNIGDILGGVLFSFILVYFLNAFQMAFFIMFINLFAALLLAFFIIKKRRFIAFFILLLLILSSIGFFLTDLDRITRQQQYKGQELLFQKDSPYGSLAVTRTMGQLNFYENGLILFSTENTVSNEETVHYAMAQLNNPRTVLLISGGVSGTIDELLKYNLSRIDYVELDPLIIELGKRYTTNLDNKKIRIINKDGRLFIRQAEARYDAVIIDLPDPDTAQLNRFYTTEFFKEARKVLDKEGVISLSLSSSDNYLNPEIRRLNSALYNSLKEHFRNTIIIPGQRNFFISSDKGLSYDIAELIKEKGIQTEYVNGFYLRGELTDERISYVRDSMIKDTKQNTDFNPVTYYYQLLLWMRHFRFNSLLFFIILIALVALYLSKAKPVQFAVFTTGFTGASLEVIILIGFQILYGYAYHQIAIIITAFMAGLAIGSYYMNKKLEGMSRKELVKLEFSIAFYSALLPIILILLGRLKNSLLVSASSQLLIPLFTLIIAVLVGMEFPLASKLFFKGKIGETAGKLYNADLIGACIGALLVSSLLIPILGILKVCFLTASLNLLSGSILMCSRGSK
ncbi:fused MFS/spermidine synthase [Candidatus Woesearchaeota archaeon]|nr:fused MFS/spermidine synthase [Candidatus Woesearchaeota archaeon]